jgi:putative transposase
VTVPPQSHRKTIRLPDYDYTASGAYFITPATHHARPGFGEIYVDQIILNSSGKIVKEEWLRTPQVRPEITLDEFVIMPDHLHGIIIITESIPVGADGLVPVLWGHPPLPPPVQRLYRPPKSLGSFVAGFKSIVTKRINLLQSTPGKPVWQRNYYEHVIRDDRDLDRIRSYIHNNPLQWTHDHPSP